MDYHWNQQLYPSRYSWETRYNQFKKFMKERVFGYYLHSENKKIARYQRIGESQVAELDHIRPRLFSNYYRAGVLAKAFIKWPGFFKTLPITLLIGPMIYCIVSCIDLNLTF